MLHCDQRDALGILIVEDRMALDLALLVGRVGDELIVFEKTAEEGVACDAPLDQHDSGP